MLTVLLKFPAGQAEVWVRLTIKPQQKKTEYSSNPNPFPDVYHDDGHGCGYGYEEKKE